MLQRTIRKQATREAQAYTLLETSTRRRLAQDGTVLHVCGPSAVSCRIRNGLSSPPALLTCRRQVPQALSFSHTIPVLATFSKSGLAVAGGTTLTLPAALKKSAIASIKGASSA